MPSSTNVVKSVKWHSCLAFQKAHETSQMARDTAETQGSMPQQDPRLPGMGPLFRVLPLRLGELFHNSLLILCNSLGKFLAVSDP